MTQEYCDVQKGPEAILDRKWPTPFETVLYCITDKCIVAVTQG